MKTANKKRWKCLEKIFVYVFRVQKKKLMRSAKMIPDNQSRCNFLLTFWFERAVHICTRSTEYYFSIFLLLLAKCVCFFCYFYVIVHVLTLEYKFHLHFSFLFFSIFLQLLLLLILYFSLLFASFLFKQFFYSSLFR